MSKTNSLKPHINCNDHLEATHIALEITELRESGVR